MAHLEVPERNVLQVIIMACVLHNVHEAWGEVVRKAWAEAACQVEVTWWQEHELQCQCQ